MATTPEEPTGPRTDARRIMSDEPVKPVARADTSVPRSERVRKNAAAENDVTVNEGHVYKEKNGTAEVIPFFVDFATARVRFAPVGRASEDEMRMSDFLNRFEEVDKSSFAEASPAASQKAAESRIEKRETTDQLGRVVMRDGKPV